MDASRPYADVIPGARGSLFAVLVQVEEPVTVRALARHAGISPQAALDHVNDLEQAGLVVVNRAGAALMVSLNREHLAAEALTALVELRGRLIEALERELATWKQLAGAWLFGSMARGDGTRDSDVDLLLVAETSTDDPKWIAATARLGDRVRAWTGNEVQLVEHTRRSLARLVRSGSPLTEGVATEGIALTEGSGLLLRRIA